MQGMTAREDFQIFRRSVEARSKEHHQAMGVAVALGWWAIVGTVLRMELDSMVRVLYLLRTPGARQRILASCVAGGGFKDGGRRIQDRDMVAVAVADNDWVSAVYEFGNKFVHLTDAHDYAEIDPFSAYEHREEVIRYLNQHHRHRLPDRPLNNESTLADIALYAPYVLEKITSNLRNYLEWLGKEVSQNG